MRLHQHPKCPAHQCHHIVRQLLAIAIGVPLRVDAAQDAGGRHVPKSKKGGGTERSRVQAFVGV